MAEESSRIQVTTRKLFFAPAIIGAMSAAIVYGGVHLYEIKYRCPTGVYRNTSTPPPACWYDYTDSSGNPQHVPLNTCPPGC